MLRTVDLGYSNGVNSLMKILFVGLGSIGQRHALILKKDYRHDLYAFRSGIENSTNGLGIKEIRDWKEVEKIKPDVVFITNPTYLHIETAVKCANLGCKLFIEKPIGSDLKDLEKLLKIVKRKELITYVGYNLRFHPVVKQLKRYISKYKFLHARVVCTSYLPNWRKRTDFLKSYSANSKMGGGVILDLSHELDYISYLLGSVKNIKGNFAKRGNVTLDAEDYADIIVDTQNGPANMHINFLSNLKQRYIQIDFEELTVVGDILNSEIKEFKNEKLRKEYKLDYDSGQDYKEQIKYFFKNINNPKMMNNLIEASELFKTMINFKNA